MDQKGKKTCQMLLMAIHGDLGRGQERDNGLDAGDIFFFNFDLCRLEI